MFFDGNFFSKYGSKKLITLRGIDQRRKVKVMLRVSGGPCSAPANNGGLGAEGASGAAAGTSSFFSIDKRRKQVTLFDPAACGGGSSAPEDRRVGVAAPKMFAFDAIFSQEDSQNALDSKPPLLLSPSPRAILSLVIGTVDCIAPAGLGLHRERSFGSRKRSKDRLFGVPVADLIDCSEEKKYHLSSLTRRLLIAPADAD
ncbi:hypothetical protein J437_LFUL007389 [Ladona fulva]|uniref:Uncharacterized protein n=1 Tax=Ladona fulva TaxID=123851 RepID=A0A8K0PAW3_LADFU|nr:hypothetical protein J437_LFUL007389 [Ladona fulva]